jgi:hypothetical protein
MAWTAALAGFATPASAQAQDEQAIDALIDESSPQRAIATAQAQTANGDLLGAAATLERALLVDPNANDARLMYAATLCRLGDPRGAHSEIAKLDRQAISDSAWSEAERACGALQRPSPPHDQSGSGLSGEAYAGLAYDSDAAGAVVLQLDTGFTPVNHEDGFSAIAGVRLGLRSTGYGANGGFYGSVSGTAKHDISGPELAYEVGEARAGFGRAAGPFGFTIGGVVRHMRLLGDPYETEFGPQGELVFAVGGSRHIRLRAEAVDQNYRGRFPGNGGDGMHYDLSAAFEAPLGGNGGFAVGIGGEIKTADSRNLAYRGARLFGVAQLPVGGRGHYVNLSGTLRYLDFRDDSPLPDRKDTRVFARAAYGLPLIQQLFLEGAASYTLRSSKLSATAPFTTVGDLADYDSVGGEARLIWKF